MQMHGQMVCNDNIFVVSMHFDGLFDCSKDNFSLVDSY